MNRELPQVTVVIPAWRAEETLPRAVSSLLEQTLTDWEAVIVADDHADYRAVLAAAGIRDRRLRFAGTGRPASGPGRARNVGLAAARGRVLAWLDADDRYAPQRLARLVPAALLCGAAADNVRVVRDRDDAPLSVLFAPVPSTLTVTDFLDTSVPMFLVCRHDCFAAWDEDLPFAEDVIFNLRVLDRLKAIPLEPEPLYEYRVREGSLAASPESAQAADQAYAMLLDGLERDGLGLSCRFVRAKLRRRLELKRQLNQAFAEARQAGRCENFQEFLTQPSPVLPNPARA